MTKLYHQIKIDAPVEEVWSILSDLEEVAKYNKQVKSAKYISENRQGIGASRECDLGNGFVKERVIEVEEGKSLSIELYENNWGLKSMKWKTDLLPEGNSTLMKQESEYEPGMGILGKILNVLFMRKKLESTMTNLFKDLKEYAEKKYQKV